jgi:hypothetical protein
MMRSKIVTTMALGLMLAAAAVPLADAGCTRGPVADTTVCQAFGSVTYHETFRAGQTARVAIVGDGATDLDIFIYDPQGRLVAQGIGPTDIEVVSWVPAQTQTYRIVVVNLGGAANRYSLATN